MSYSEGLKNLLASQIEKIKNEGLYKGERYILSSQDTIVSVESPIGVKRQNIINMCSNNYLGLSNHPEILKAARAGMKKKGFGLSSVRFICGTQDIHRELEVKVTNFLSTEDTILFLSAFDANHGIFEALLNDEDIILSDRLVHASVIDGIRLSRASHDSFKHSNLEHLEEKLMQYQNKRIKLVVTDGVFSMDGDLAKLDNLVDLCEKYSALLVVDDSHGTGVIGLTGRGTHEYFGLNDKIDLLISTFGKALGGASGGFASGRKEIIELCRQKSRPFLFSNSIPPPVVSGVIKGLDIISRDFTLKNKLEKNKEFWRNGLISEGFIVQEGNSPIVPVMLYDSKLTQSFSNDLFDAGVLAVGFSFPVVPLGQARIRTQLSAKHETDQLNKALKAFKKIGEKYNILGKTKDQIINKI